MNDRERLIDILYKGFYISPGNDIKGTVQKAADYLIANGVTVQKHGRWIDGAENFTYGNHNAECSACHCNVSWSGCDEDFNYCPNCGAKMGGEA